MEYIDNLPAMDLMSSEKMTFVQLIIPVESAYRTISYLGQLGLLQFRDELVKQLNLYGKLVGHEGCVNAIEFNSTGELLVSGSDDRQVIFWDWAMKRRKVSYHSGHLDNIFQTKIMPFSDDRKIVTSAGDGQKHMGMGPNPLSLLPEELQKLEEPQVYSGHRNSQTIKGVNFFGADDDYVVTGSDCGHIFIWKKKGAKLVRLMVGDRHIVNQLESHPSMPTLATCGIEKNVKLWTPTSKKVQPLPADVEEIMESNRQGREDRSRVALTPDVIMHVLRLQRRQTVAYIERRYSGADDESDEDDGAAFLVGFPDEDAVSEEANPGECSVS